MKDHTLFYAVTFFSWTIVWANISIDVETPRNTHLIEGGQPERITVRLRADSDPAQCFLQQTKDSTAKLYDNYILTVKKDQKKVFYEPFLTRLSDSTQELTIDVLALKDSDIENDEYFGINILCSKWDDFSKDVVYKSIRTIRFLILVENNNVNEPYLRQIVKDEKKGVCHRICYELNSKYGKILELFRGEKSNVTVNVELKKQFIQVVFIDTLFGKFYINSTGFTLPNGFFYSWESNLAFFALEQRAFIIEFTKNMLIIIIKHEMQTVSISIKRTLNMQLSTEYFFDISFPSLTTSYEKVYGLVGHLGRIKFTFHDPVQTGTQGAKETLIGINGVQRRSYFALKQGRECWFIDVQDTLESFVLDLKY